ncbi:hypothetical protein [Streptomyces sp. NBC_00096]|uniref:hypothetical protein n=1 Tax=Streptomyces sp. NBC_00096 TaxID=2975650 RepID=UPI003243C974
MGDVKGRMRQWWRQSAGRVAAAAGVPPLAACGALAAGRAGTGYLGGGWVVLFGAVLPLAGLLVHAALAGRRGEVLAAWAALPAAVGVFLALTAADDLVLRERGVEVTCVVKEVTSRVEKDSYFTPDGQHLTTTVKYDHLLACPPDGPTGLTGEEKLAKAGDELRLVYDPRGRLEPRDPAELHAVGLRSAALGAVGLAVAMGVLGTLAGAAERRSRLRGR